jgi:hypothetical protein
MKHKIYQTETADKGNVSMIDCKAPHTLLYLGVYKISIMIDCKSVARRQKIIGMCVP